MNIVPILFNLRSIHNVGSIFRTADGVGCREIILTGFTPSPFDRFGSVRADFQKVALGAHERVAFRQFPDIKEAVHYLKQEGFFIVALEQSENSIPYNSFHTHFPQAEKVALILGNEPKGIPHEIMEHANAIIEIPMRGTKESLNVSVAFGIAAYELVKN